MGVLAEGHQGFAVFIVTINNRRPVPPGLLGGRADFVVRPLKIDKIYLYSHIRHVPFVYEELDRTTDIDGRTRQQPTEISMKEGPVTQDSRQQKIDVLAAALNGLADGVAVVDLDGNLLFVNEEAKKIVGAGAWEIRPADWTKDDGCFLPDKKTPYPPDRLPLARAMRGEEVVDDVLFMKSTSGPSERWLNACSKPLRDENGTIRGAIVLFRNITKHKMAEERLRSTSSRFSALVENQQAGVLVESEDRQVLLINQAFGDLFAVPVSPRELQGDDCVQLADRAKTLFADPEGFVSRLEQILQDRCVVINEKLQLADGRVFERDYIPVSVGNDYCGHMWQYRDITEHQKSQHRIRVYERLCTALEQTADNVVITDRQGRIEYVNPAFETTTGYSRDEVLGETPRILKSGKHDEQFYRELWSKVLAGESFEGTIVNRKKSGELYWSRQTITPMKDDRGEITHFVSVLKDITELLKQQEHEAEMRLARQVQQRFYKTTTVVPGFDIAGTSHPIHETGGDYFDFIPMPDGRLGIAIGDVSRHGISSALVMAETRAYLRAFASDCADLGEILTRVNRSLIPDLDSGGFVTLLLVCLDPRRRSVVYASAGHLPGYLLDQSGRISSVMESTGPPLGLLPDYTFPTGEVPPLASGQVMLLMTDGIAESLAREDIDLGMTRAVEFVRAHRHEPARQIVETLCQTAQSGVTDGQPQDDATSIILKVM